MNDTPNDSSAGSTDPVTVVGGPGLFGGFVLLEKLGAGGMGEVWLAEDTKLKRRVAIKAMRPELTANKLDRDRFEREARAAAAVEHDNIVPILHVGEAGEDTPFIVMPFLKGESLDARLKREPVARVGLILKVAGEVAEGLAAAHAVGLIHRDIKPANIWLDGDLASGEPGQQVRRCKILDFGLARSVEKGDVQITASGAVLGTPAYMAPEQARGEKVDVRADLFSLGATLYRMATGQLPFNGPNPLAVVIALTTETPTPVRTLAPHLPPELADLIERLMRKDRAGRPGSAAEVAATVRKLVEARGEKEPARASISESFPQLLSGEGVPEPRAKRRRVPWVIAAACLFALVPLGLWRAGAFDEKKPTQDGAKNESPPKPAEPIADPDRTAAAYVLSIGGDVGVQINTEHRNIHAGGELPKVPFRLTRVWFPEKSSVTDADLAVFKDCRGLMALSAINTSVGDAGVAHLAGCKGLIYLYLPNTKVGPAGLAALKDCTELRELNLSDTPMTDAGLTHLKGFTQLTRLLLGGTEVTATGVADLTKALPGCDIDWDGAPRKPVVDSDRGAAEWVLKAGGTVHINTAGNEIKDAKALPKEPFKLIEISLAAPVKDADLAAVAGCKNLTGAYLVGTGITNAGLAHLADCKNLTSLFLSGTKVDDKSVAVLKRFTQLTDLSVGQTDISEKGVNELANALPVCRIQHNGGTIPPATEADRKAAEFVLSILGTVRVNGGGEVLKFAKELPPGPFRLTWVGLLGNAGATDAGLAPFAGCTSLTYLELSVTPVTDAGLAHFKNCKNLTHLYMWGTKVGDPGLAHFAGSKSLTHLDLNGTQVTNLGLSHFKDSERLTALRCNSSAIGDAAVGQIEQFRQLTELNVVKTKMTEKGVNELKKALPECTIAWDGGVIKPGMK